MIRGFVAGVGVVLFAVLAKMGASVGAIVFLGLTWLIWFFVAVAVESKHDQARLGKLGALLPLPYEKSVRWITTGLARWLLPETVTQNPMPQKGLLRKLDWAMTLYARDDTDLRRLLWNPWAWPVFNLALGVALVYPIYFVLIQFAVSGSATGLGGLALITGDTPAWFAYVTIGAIAVIVVSRILASATSKGVYEKLSMWLTIGAFAFAFALAFAFAVAFAIVGLVGWATRTGHGLWGSALLALFTGGAGFVAAVVLPADQTEVAVVIVTFALFPAINGVFDWLSYGITIRLLLFGFDKRGPWPWLAALADFFAAIMMFFLLSLALSLVLGGVNSLRPTPLVDLAVLFEGVRTTPKDYLWVYAMIGSTLLPTFVHMVIGFLSALTLWPAHIWKRLALGLDPARSAQLPILASVGRAGRLLVNAIVFASPLLFAGWLLWRYGGLLRILYVDTLEWILAYVGLL